MTAQIFSFVTGKEKLKELRCSFCNKPKSKVPHQKLVSNGEKHICMECLVKCKKILDEAPEK